MKPPTAYAFAARYEKPGYLSLADYLWDLESILKAVFNILDHTTIGQRYTHRETRKNVDLIRGSTAKGIYVFARMNPEINIVSEDHQLVSQIRYQYRERFVIPPKRIPRDMVRLDSDVHQMMHELFGEDLKESTAHGKQMSLQL